MRCAWLWGMAIGAACTADPAAAQHRAAEGIDGWGPFRFHMNLETARSAGLGLGQTDTQWDEQDGQVLILTANVAGEPTPVRVVFRGWHEPIKHIVIQALSYRTDDKAKCLAQLEPLAAKVRKNYQDFQEYPAERAAGDGVFLRNVDLRFRDGSWIQVEVHYNTNRNERDGQTCEGNVFYFPSHTAAALDY